MKKVHRLIKFNQNAWLKPYTDRNTDLRKEAKNDFKWWIMQVLEKLCKMWENRQILNLSQQKEEENICLVSEPNHHTKRFLTENFWAIEMKKSRQLWISLSI